MQIEIICNTPDEVLFHNISTNSLTHDKWVRKEAAHDGHAVIVGGGPSLIDTLPLIRKRYELGQQIFALNGAASFLNDHGITPDYQVILDAREETADLVDNAHAHLVASQCHPSVLAELPDAILWHPVIDNICDNIPDHNDSYALVGGGTTVGLSSMALAYTLGFRKLHLFGFDSSHRDTYGHAYRQKMNDRDVLCKVTHGDRVFTSSLAMARQAEIFPQVCNNLVDLGCIITVDGDGLIRAVVDDMINEPQERT